MELGARQVKGAPVPTGVPIWVAIVVGIVLPVVGWVSRELANRWQAKVQDKLGLHEAQRQHSEHLAARVKELEDRQERLQSQHHRELQELHDAYQRQIRTLTDGYEGRIAHLERQIASVATGLQSTDG